MDADDIGELCAAIGELRAAIVENQVAKLFNRMIWVIHTNRP